MERYKDYKKHTVDTYARIVVKAMKAVGNYDSEKHDAVIMAVVAPLMARLEQARASIATLGVVVNQTSREGSDRWVKNPACDLELQIAAQLRLQLRDLGIYDSLPVADDNDAGEEGQKKVDGLQAIADMLHGVKDEVYRNPKTGT